MALAITTMFAGVAASAGSSTDAAVAPAAAVASRVRRVSIAGTPPHAELLRLDVLECQDVGAQYAPRYAAPQEHLDELAAPSATDHYCNYNLRGGLSINHLAESGP